MAVDTDLFSASASALGYIYQCRYALLEAVRRLRDQVDFNVAFETLDDVVFEKVGGVLDLLQTKHHVKHVANLTDASPDLWKSLRVWAELFQAAGVPEGARRFLVTTARAGDGSAASYLGGAMRDEAKALERLRAIAMSSTNKANEPAYDAFRTLSGEQQTRLIASLVVLDGSPSIADVQDSLEKELILTADRKLVPALVERLEGWWFRRAIQHLDGRSAKHILSQELESEISSLREQFKEDNLPIDNDLLDAEVDATVYGDRTFVHQLHLIDLSAKRVMIAVREFYRAFEQRSRWMREELLFVGELDRYEKRLIEEWEIHFEQMHEELGAQATEVVKKKAARALFKWVESEADLPIRVSCTAAFVTRGSLHMLADKKRVGWHPDFVARLAELLASVGVA